MKKGKFGVFDVCLYIFMVFFMFTIIYPFWDLLIKSFSTPAEASKMSFTLIPKSFTLASYKAVFTGSNIGVAYVNTILRTVLGTIGGIIVNTCGAYALSKKSLPFRNGITLFLIFTMFFSGGLIPSYMLIKGLQLIDTLWVLIIPGLASVYNLVIIRNYIQSLDKGLEESASIDGASQYVILFKIILPICKPIIATVALWTMVAHWNAWFDALIYTNSVRLTVLQLALRNILVQNDSMEMSKYMTLSGDASSAFTPDTIKAAFMYVTITPILFTYPFLQKYFVKGIMVGSFKG